MYWKTQQKNMISPASSTKTKQNYQTYICFGVSLLVLLGLVVSFCGLPYQYANDRNSVVTYLAAHFSFQSSL